MPGLTGIFADEEVSAISGDEQPVAARRMRNQIGQDTGLLIVSQHLERRPSEAVIAAAVDMAVGRPILRRDAQEQIPVIGTAGDLADQEVACS